MSRFWKILKGQTIWGLIYFVLIFLLYTWANFTELLSRKKLLTRNICLAGFVGYHASLRTKWVYFAGSLFYIAQPKYLLSKIFLYKPWLSTEHHHICTSYLRMWLLYFWLTIWKQIYWTKKLLPLYFSLWGVLRAVADWWLSRRRSLRHRIWRTFSRSLEERPLWFVSHWNTLVRQGIKWCCHLWKSMLLVYSWCKFIDLYHNAAIFVGLGL